MGRAGALLCIGVVIWPCKLLIRDAKELISHARALACCLWYLISITLSTGIVASALDIFTVKKKETEAVADNIINSMWATKGGGSAGMAEDLVSLTAMHPAIVMDTAKESFILHFNKFL